MMMPHLIAAAQWLGWTRGKSNHAERRTAERRQLHFDAQVTLSIGSLSVRGVNIHPTGLGVLSSRPLPEGSSVFVRIKSLGLVGFAQVRHCNPHGLFSYSIGLEFQSKPMRQDAGN